MLKDVIERGYLNIRIAYRAKLMARVGYLYISDASCDYILVINISMLLGNIFGNKDNHTAIRLFSESLVFLRKPSQHFITLKR